MALACNQHQVGWSCLGNGCGDGRGPIRLNLQRGSCRDASQHILKDALGIFGAGIVGGDNDPVGQLGGDRPHLGPLAAIAVTAATKHADQTTVGERATGPEGARQAIGGVGVIHQHRRSRDALWGEHLFHAPGHAAEAGQRLQQGRQG